MLRSGEYFGAGHLIDILTGNLTEKVRHRGHDQLSCFAIGGDYDRRQWQAIFRQIMGQDLVRPDPERHGALRMRQAARPILRGEATITLRQDSLRKAGAPRPAVKALVSEEDAPLLAALKAQRRALAEAARVPAYVVFTDRTLIEIAEKRPATLDAMARISGIGATKLERYGALFLAVVTGAEMDPVHPARRKLAGKGDGAIYDRLLQAQADLAYGESGIDKPLSCSATLLAKVASMHQVDGASLARLLGERRSERFGAAFLQVLQRA